MNNSIHKPPIINELTEKISPFFSVYDVRQQEGSIYFFITPKKADEVIKADDNGSGINHLEPNVIYQNLWVIFAEKGYQFSFRNELGEHMLIATPFKNEGYWINIALVLATIVTTMVMGSSLFGVDLANIENNPSDVLKGIPFTVAIMSILGAHEAGHYLVAKKHGMRTSLPYFIPVPFPPTGTMGAVIKHRGPIPSRKALFDVGISGPLIGLFLSVIVTAIGLLQPPITHNSEKGIQIILGLPPLFEFIMSLVPAGEISTIHPIAFAGWVGMLLTALNLIPAGQLDGGHVLRAMIGEKATRVSKVLPFLVISLGLYLTYFQNMDGSIWVFWGFLLAIFAAIGHPRPLNDDVSLGRGRMVLGVITFILGLLSITPVPLQVR